MKFKEFFVGKKTRWILPAGVAAVIIVVVAVVMMNNAAAAAAAAEAKTVTKETTVQKGNITVGVTETGTASIGTESVICNLNGAIINEVNIKAGQSVKTGDAIATLTTDSVDTAIQTLDLAYTQAENKLSQAEAAQATGKVSAKTTYNTSKAKSDNAQTTYNNTISSLQDAVTSATNSYNSCVGTINYYTAKLAGLDTSTLQATKEAADAALQAVTSSDPNYPALKQAADIADENYSGYAALVAQQQQLSSLENKLKSAQDALTSGTVTAKAQYDNDKASGSSASTIYNNTLAALQSDVDSATLSVTTAKQALDKVSQYKTDPTIYATIDGLVNSVSVAAGDTLSNNAVIASIADNTSADVIVSVTQDDISSLSVGQTAEVSLTSFSDTTFEGTIDSITITPAREASSTVSYSITVKLSGDVSKIYDGMTGNVTFVTKQVKDVLYVSNKAVTTENGKQYVNVKDSSGKTVKTQVTTGFSDGQNVEIQSGLTEGQTIVITSQAVTSK